MIKILGLALTALSVMAIPAVAQEQQVYYPPGMTRSYLTHEDLVARQNYIIAQQQYNLTNSQIVRDPTATARGYIPQHPGDYRDAYDRGELPNLGGTSRKGNKPIVRPQY